MSSRVLVPLVDAAGSGDQFLEALASDIAPPPHPAKLAAEISELFDLGLYKTGQIVREAVHRFTDKRLDHVWLGRWNRLMKPWFLRLSDLQVGRLADENARSAGLGLTVAALLQHFDREHMLVFATGEIRLPEGPSAGKTANIGGVGGIDEKLILIGNYMNRHRLELTGQTAIVILPKYDLDGGLLEETAGAILRRLRQDADYNGVNLKIEFLEQVDDLDRAFGAPFRPMERISRKTAAVAGIFLFSATAIGSGVHWAQTRPIQVQWEHILETSDQASPRRAEYDSTADRFNILPECFDGQRQPLIRGGETVLARVRIADHYPISRTFWKPTVYLVAASINSDPIVMKSELFKRIPDTGESGFGSETLLIALPVETTIDEVRIVVVATRKNDITASNLVSSLKTALDGVEGSAVLSLAAGHLRDRFEGFVDFQFRVIVNENECT